VAKSNDYTATATAEKRLREILERGDVGGHLGLKGDPVIGTVISDLTGAGVLIELKPRLKAVQLTIPIPQPRPEPKLGAFAPKPEPEDGYDDGDDLPVG
jgi:hypothetical protein